MLCTACKLTFVSGIFGYINYLVERDRRFILDTLLNGGSSSTLYVVIET